MAEDFVDAENAVHGEEGAEEGSRRGAAFHSSVRGSVVLTFVDGSLLTSHGRGG